MQIKKITEKDIIELNKIIKTEFSYTNFTNDKLIEKINLSNFYLIKLIDKSKLIGFLEIEQIDNEKARLNAIYIDNKYRRKGLATKLINNGLKQSKKNGIKTIFLLVKEKNDIAKKVYEKNGFNYTKEHDKIIENSVIEIYEKTLF
ncbi:MAG: GNAT family N-acetyltransferase [Candidatus ainarchaeum sp.]|nr:GNAT family N-acetyltransferase [Candidatus ainarchaeum sp.]